MRPWQIVVGVLLVGYLLFSTYRLGVDAGEREWRDKHFEVRGELATRRVYDLNDSLHRHASSYEPHWLLGDLEDCQLRVRRLVRRVERLR